MKLTYNDRQHAYWLDGKRCKSVTQVAKIPDDQFTLSKWRQRMIAIGMASDPDLIERAAAHYDDRDILDAICDEAAKAAGAHRKADRGTAAHRITERHDAGELIIETDFSRRVRDAWQQAMEDAGLEVAYDSQGRPLQERVVVWPEQLVCGKFDRICRRADGSLVVVDLKTGDGAIKYPHSIAIQLALYAYAPLIAGPLPVGGGSTEEFENPYQMFWGIDHGVGLVVHMPDEGPVQVHEFDIGTGIGAAYTVCFGAMAWRKQASLCWPLGARSEDDRGTDPDSTEPSKRSRGVVVDPQLDAIPAGDDDGADGPRDGRLDEAVRRQEAPDERGLDPAAESRRSNDAQAVRPRASDEASPVPVGDSVDGDTSPSGLPAVRDEGTPVDPAALLAAIEALPPDVYDTLKRYATERQLPAPKRLTAATPEQLAAVAAAVQQAKDACLYETQFVTAERIEEGRRELIERSRRSNDARDDQPMAGAGAETPARGDGQPDERRHVRPLAAREVDEGPPADPAAIDALTRHLAQLTAPQQNIIKDWLAQARAAGVFFGNLKQNPTVRRFALARACWALVAHMDGDDELVRLALAFVAGDDAVQPAFPTGAIIGALTPSEADLVYGVCARYKAGELKVGFSATPPYPGRLESVA